MRIAVTDLDLRYGDLLAAEKITFDVRPGEFVSLIGPSGCGKSSVLRALGGLQPPAGGEITVDGDRVRGPLPARIAYVFQDLALFPWRSARRNVEVPLELRGVPRRQRRARADELLAKVGLADAADQHPAQLSGGMRQRVAIARALASDAGILLLDEPFAALDEQTRLRLGAELLRLLEEEGKTVVFVTHSLQEAAYLSDRIVVLSPRPATVKEILTVPRPRPKIGSDEFHRLHARLTDLLFEVEPA
ncbi:ABC transporter ATP-binding protein [Paractinoplanes toevensis]|uniref:ATP-binding protein n=1 Tax=Paractinoplanes toevensis TaxID=571911 RepID=A0A919T7C7_9ACTN|nr:ABC transporter ATP-binding protein [Actinoplanes toevensis]GIM89772.1 ATP-binding protein [Actinoplanes toevensis]